MPKTSAASGRKKSTPTKKSKNASKSKKKAARSTQPRKKPSAPKKKAAASRTSATKKPATSKSKKKPARKVAGKKPARSKATTRAPSAGGKARSTRAGSPRTPAPVHATLRELEGALKKLPKLDIVAPNIPVERLVAEGVELASVAWRDLRKLETAGLDHRIVVELGKRAQALSEAQAELVALRSRGRSSEEEDLLAEATELRSEALAAGRLALRNDPIALSKLDDVAEGEGLDDLLQDLQDLAALLRSYARAYSQVGLKPSELANWSETLRLRLSKYIAERRAGDADLAAAKDLRDRAATYLSDAVALTRLTGAYVFRKDPRKLLNYRSGYNAERRARKGDPGTPPSPPAPPTPPSDDNK
ncbi:MAG: hypothetical protein JNJ46_34705 [Myxococcales bacterium]|nr:hypothetical protein [Myxococcales bacterium]